MKKVISFSVWKDRIPTRQANQPGVDGDENLNTNSLVKELNKEGTVLSLCSARTTNREDRLTDKIGLLLKKAAAIPSLTNEKREILAQATCVMKASGYISYKAKVIYIQKGGKHCAIRIGDSCITNIPPSKRGNLQAFRGKRIRIVCISGGGYMTKQYLAGSVSNQN